MLLSQLRLTYVVCGLLTGGVLLLNAGCDAGGTDEAAAIPVTLMFDEDVETPPVDSVRVRLLNYDHSGGDVV